MTFPDLSFVQHPLHRRLLLKELAQARNAGALGLMLCGSVARGTARPTSDLDLRLYWTEGRPFETEEREGVLIERHGHTLERAREQVTAGGSALYAWTEGRVLHDPEGTLAQLGERARAHLAAYRTPPAEAQALAHWLRSTLTKLRGSGEEQATFLVHTNTWKLAEAVCALNHRPVPPATLMWEMLPELPEQPEDGWLSALLLGGTETCREAFERAARWVLPHLDALSLTLSP